MTDLGTMEDGLQTATAKPKRRRKLMVVLVASLFALAAAYGAWRWAAAPHVNKNPQRKVEVHGVFPYDRGWDLQIKASFYTRNPSCKRTARAFGIFPMAQVARQAWSEIPVIREGGNRYRFTYYEDYLEPGYCEWEQRFVYSHMFLDGAWEHGNSAIMGLNQQYNQINYQCFYSNRLMPGKGRDAREISLGCFNFPEKDNKHIPSLTDIELNYVFSSKVDYDYYGPTGKRESKWIEGETK